MNLCSVLDSGKKSSLRLVDFGPSGARLVLYITRFLLQDGGWQTHDQPASPLAPLMGILGVRGQWRRYICALAVLSTVDVPMDPNHI